MMKNKLLKTTIAFFITIQNVIANDIQDINNLAQTEDLTIWIAIFGLAIIAVFALYLSSEEIKLFKQRYKEKEKIKEEILKSENEFVSKIGESIHDIAKDEKSKTKLLVITTNLIDFLKIKSKKIYTSKDDFTFSNLLNDVSGILQTNTNEKEFELIYDIDINLPHKITSDTLNLSKILSNILTYTVEQNSKKIILKIEKNSIKSKSDHIFFTIDTNLKTKVEIGDEIFNAIYNDVEQSYDNLSLFIAKELAQIMDSELIARNNEEEKLEFLLSIPFLPKDDNKTLEDIESKKILIIDANEDSALHIQKILKALKHDVTIQATKDTYPNINYLSKFELVFLDDKIINKNMIDICKKLNLKVITYYDIFNPSQHQNTPKHNYTKISKPFTHWQISTTIDALFQNTLEQKTKIDLNSHKIITNSGNISVYKSTFKATKNIVLSNFICFKNKKILLVEDNLLNQKVFVGILGKSQMNILTAVNGQEALDILEKHNDIEMIFMDINMPVMDGYTATLHIRSNTLYDNIAIVALTALTSVDEINKMFKFGMNAYLSKPLRKEILFSVLSTFFKDIDTNITYKEKENKPIELKGLDVKAGIKKAASSEVFYKEILLEFKDAYQDSPQKLTKYIDDFRFEQVKILALDIKGLSGTIGAQELHDSATNIIKAIVLKNYASLGDLLKIYQTNLQTTITSINQYNHLV